MTFDEFAGPIKMLQAGIASGTNREFSQETLAAWFETLKDLNVGQFQAAVVRYLQQYESGFPSIATIRKLAVESEQGQLLAPEAGIAKVRDAIKRFGYIRPTEALASLDEITREALRRSGGYQQWCDMAPDRRTTAHAQFKKSYETLAGEVMQGRVLTENVRPRISNEGTGQRKIEGDGPSKLGDLI